MRYEQRAGEWVGGQDKEQVEEQVREHTVKRNIEGERNRKGKRDAHRNTSSPTEGETMSGMSSAEYSRTLLRQCTLVIMLL